MLRRIKIELVANTRETLEAKPIANHLRNLLLDDVSNDIKIIAIEKISVEAHDGSDNTDIFGAAQNLVEAIDMNVEHFLTTDYESYTLCVPICETNFKNVDGNTIRLQGIELEINMLKKALKIG